MSARATLLLLFLANLAFLAWATLVDVAPEPPPSDSISQLPRLQLLSEVKAHRPAVNPGSAPANNAPANSAPASGAPAAATGASPPAGASAPANVSAPTNVSTPANVSATGNEASSAGAVNGSVANSDPPASAATASIDRCVTIGPFNDEQRATEASALLQQRGFRPRSRDAETQRHGYWVYIDGLDSQSAETSTIRRLERNGIVDAKIMPNLAGKGRRVSVGLFTRHDDAERRARAVRGLGLDVQIEEQHPMQAGHWVDVNLDSSTQSLPTASLLSLQDDGSRLEIAECPAAAQPSAAEDRSSEAGSRSDKPGRLAPPAPASGPAISKALSAQRLSQPG